MLPGIDPAIHAEALRIVARGECPRHLFGFVADPELTDQRVEPHTGVIAEKLLRDAGSCPLAQLLDAFPGSKVITIEDGHPGVGDTARQI